GAAGGLMLLTMLVAARDVRFGWTRLPLPLHVAGLAATVLGYAIFLWAMASNAFFAGGVRVQHEREHAVVTRGPYRRVRHPGYAGTIAAQLGTPLLLGSLWAFIPAFLLVLLFVVRTRFEDRTLAEELPGYDAYARRTRFRLLPGIWYPSC